MDVSSIIQEMREAVRLEREAVGRSLEHLRSGPSLTAMGGRRLFGEPGAYGYRFELELAELLPDGTKVQVYTPARRVVGEVVDHDPALGRLDLLLREDLGPAVREARLDFDATHLLTLLSDRLSTLQADRGPAAERALCFLAGEVEPKPPVDVSLPGLSASQQRAVGFVLGQQAAYLWGPPGTGKTQTVARLVLALIARSERVLLTAHTNIAVDTALLRVLRLRDFPRGSVVRVGYVSEELRPCGVGLDQLADETIRGEDPALTCAIEELCLSLAGPARHSGLELPSPQAPLPVRLRAAAEIASGLRHDVQLEDGLNNRIARLLDEVRAVERRIVDGAQLVASTLTGLYTNATLRTLQTDTVVIDEASIASLTLTFVAACAGNRCVAAGDFMQLPAIVHSEEPLARKWLGRHVFASAGCDRPDRPHRLRVMLDEQWRMHPRISGVVSRLFYAGMLRDAPPVLARSGPGPAIALLDTSGLRPTSENASGSKRNPVHAGLVAKLAASSPARGVAVIAPYRAQVRAIRDALRRLAPTRLATGDIEVFTVHRFQGRDKALVIFDLVEAPGARCRFLDEHENPDTPNLINVALSRAKDRLVIVGCMAHLAQSLGRSALVNRVFSAARAAGAIEVEAGNPGDEAELDALLREP